MELNRLSKKHKSIRGWEIDIEIGLWRYLLQISIAPFNWRKWFFYHGSQLGTDHPAFHLYIGPFHIWSFTSDRNTLVQFRLGTSFNWVWWDKLTKPRGGV